jgi:hypothetical protein
MRAPALRNLDPARLASQALQSASGRAWVVATLGYILRHCREDAEIIERTGAQICQQAGPKELRRIAEGAKQKSDSLIGEALCLRLLSGCWRLPDASSGKRRSAPLRARHSRLKINS